MASSVFVLGGARSGKSRFAVSDLARSRRVAFVATARAGDGDMARRIARHQAERPRHWKTIEEPYDLVRRLADLEEGYDAVVVDCLTLWVSNRLLRGDSDDAILDETDGLAKLIGRRATSFTVSARACTPRPGWGSVSATSSESSTRRSPPRATGSC